jgi:hypothetical protein
MPDGNRLARKVPPRLALLLPVLVYLSLFWFWQSHGLYELTGDEPHYLLIADSLYRDHDLKVENNYLSDTPVHRACKANLSDPLDIERHVRNGYSMHYVGLPLVLLIPYALAGVTGAKLFMTLLAGLWPFLLYRAAFQFIESRPWSILIALTLSLGLPYLPVSNQLYVDLLGGMIILYAAERIVGLFRGRYGQPSLASHLALGMLLGFLPWLHIRLSAPAGLLLLGYVYACFVKARRNGLTVDVRRLLIPASVVAASGLLLAAYNQYAFGNAIFGPYYGYLSFDLRKIALTFTGLHWDMAHGIFMQQPLLILALFGIIPFVRESRESALLLALVCVSVLLPNSMLSLWYGGASMYGRYNWAVASLWVFPLACAVRLLFKHRKTLILPLCAACLLLQAWMASRWAFDNGLLINTGWPAWAARNFYTYDSRLLLRLPFFKNVSDYENLTECVKHPANYVALLLSALLIASGWLYMRRKYRALVILWPLFLAAAGCALIFIPPAEPHWTITADLLPSQVGTQDSTGRVAREGEAGYLIYGPYVLLLEGSYEASLEYESGEMAAPQFDIVYDTGTKVIARVELPPSAVNGGTFKYRFSIDRGLSMKKPLELRVWYGGSGRLKVKRLRIAYLNP